MISNNRYLTIKWGSLLVFYFCSRVFFSFLPMDFVLAEDGYHGEVYYLERTLASGECRGLKGETGNSKIALQRRRSVTKFFCERIPFGKRKFDLFDL